MTFGRGWQRMFAPNKMTLGVFYPIEAFEGDAPTMKNQVHLTKLAEQYKFAAVWMRDVPLLDPTFGDVGQIYDPWVWMGYVAAQTEDIALATGSIIMSLRSPVDIAKQACSVDQLSGGRLVMGIATGDRPIEFPAYNVKHTNRDEIFRESIKYFRHLTEDEYPVVDSPLGVMVGQANLVPKPVAGHIPLLITGRSRQTMQWIAKNGDGWLYYPQAPPAQKVVVDEYRAACGSTFKPFAQSLYIDLTSDPEAPPVSIHLGFRLGRVALITLLKLLQSAGVNHVAFNLKYGQRNAEEVLKELGEFVVPHFPAIEK
jgi:luciferase-type oxidoreductase